jgi:hypothetical protein
MEPIGRGAGVAALFNARAKRVTGSRLRALERALPDALVLASEDLEQARRQVAAIAAAEPYLLLSGGGDGAVVQLLNLWRDEAGGRPFPVIGVLKLGTGNAWARVSGAMSYDALVTLLPRLPRAIPVQTFDLVEAEGTLCHFAGAGWDAHVLNDYLRNLDKRSAQLVGSRIASWFHRGLTGYFYATARLTIPDEIRRNLEHGPPRVVVESTGPLAYRIDGTGNAIPIPAGERLYDGTFGIAAGATEPELGFGIRAFPFARMKPGFMHLRIFGGGVLAAWRHGVRLWRGDLPPPPGIEDFLVTGATMRFSRSIAFQVAGDGRGDRERIEMRVAPEKVALLDWRAAMALRISETITRRRAPEWLRES